MVGAHRDCAAVDRLKLLHRLEICDEPEVYSAAHMVGPIARPASFLVPAASNRVQCALSFAISAEALSTLESFDILPDFKLRIVDELKVIIPKETAQMCPANPEIARARREFLVHCQCIPIDIDLYAFLHVAKPTSRLSLEVFAGRLIVDDVATSLTDEICHVHAVCVEQASAMALDMHGSQTEDTEHYGIILARF